MNKLLYKDLPIPASSTSSCAEVWAPRPTPPLQSAGDGGDHSAVRLGPRHARPGPHLAAATWVCGMQVCTNTPLQSAEGWHRSFILQLCGGGGDHSFSSYAACSASCTKSAACRLFSPAYQGENEMRIHLKNTLVKSKCEIQGEGLRTVWHCSNPPSPALVGTAAHEQVANKRPWRRTASSSKVATNHNNHSNKSITQHETKV
jgi:hypothetical protein